LTASPSLNELNRAVVITMVTVGMVQVTIHQIIDVIPMGHCLMATARPVHMVFIVPRAAMAVRTVFRVVLGDFKAVLIHVVPMGVMEVSVVKVVGMVSVPNRCVPAIWTMHM
jgi:hypothetical protein